MYSSRCAFVVLCRLLAKTARRIHLFFGKGSIALCIEHHGITSARRLTGVVVSALVHIAAQANKMVARLTSR